MIIGFIVLWIFTAVLAGKYGRSSIGWAALALLITPLLTCIILLCLGKTYKQRMSQMRWEEEYRASIRRQYEQPLPPIPPNRMIDEPPHGNNYRDRRRYMPKNTMVLLILSMLTLTSCNLIAPKPSSLSDYIVLGDKLVIMSENGANNYMRVMGAEVRSVVGLQSIYIIPNDAMITRRYIANIPVVEFAVEWSQEEVLEAFLEAGWEQIDNNRVTHNNVIAVFESYMGNDVCYLMFRLIRR